MCIHMCMPGGQERLSACWVKAIGLGPSFPHHLDKPNRISWDNKAQDWLQLLYPFSCNTLAAASHSPPSPNGVALCCKVIKLLIMNAAHMTTGIRAASI